MSKGNELSTKEKILRSLEESNNPRSRLIGGFTNIPFRCAVAERAMGIATEQLAKVMGIKNG